MVNSCIDKLKSIYTKYEFKISNINNTNIFEIINPFKNGNISVYLDEDDLTFYFSSQHCHFHNDFDGLVEYIDGFLSEKYVAIEFYISGKDSCGGSLDITEVDFSSPISIAKCFFKTNEITQNWFIEQFKNDKYQYKIRSWSGSKDLNADIIWNGNVFEVNLTY